jgi:hypothetical protein
MKIKNVVVFSLVAVTSAAWAGAQPPPPDPGGFTMSWQAADGQGVAVGPGVPFGAVDLVAVEPFERGRAVTDAPYSAEAITEVTQALADGNRIQRRTSAKVARDSQGRVRREQQAMALGGLVAEADTLIVTISDPVTGTFVTFNQGDKVAMRSREFGAAGRMEAIGRLRDPATAGGVMVSPSMGARTFGGAETTVGVDTQSLGTQDIEGVKAEGTRTTTTIPAGAIGNELPIEMVGERWYSPELQVVVMTRRSDPRFGETIYRLTNIVRAEPAATLFQVPADLRIQEPKVVPLPRKP